VAAAEQSLAGGKLLLDFPAEAVARLTISNPERRNALDHDILGALTEALPPLGEGIEHRCLLITGAPPVFSAGYDIAGIPESSFETDAEALVANPFHAAMEAVSAHPYPTVAAINGHCLGGGLERFIEVVGIARTRELFLVGRNYDGERAESIGLVNEAVPADEVAAAALELAEEIVGNAPISTRGNKRAIEALARNPVLSADQERELVELRRSCFASEDFREGIKAFAEKRKPRWTGT
jgi:enoyl-CoA hydratase/carnithine racemase